MESNASKQMLRIKISLNTASNFPTIYIECLNNGIWIQYSNPVVQ